MKTKILIQNQDTSSTGYAPTIQSTTGKFCVTQTTSWTSEPFYSENSSSSEIG